jgi:transposase
LATERLPTPRADGDREALRILLGARHDLTVTSTAKINRLRALLRDAHDDSDRQLARTALTDATLARLARRHLPRGVSRDHAIRHAAIRRITLAIHTPARHSQATASNCSPSSTTSHPASPNAPGSDPSPPPRPS